MIDLDGAVRDFMKDIGKTLRPMGFRGSRNHWTLETDNGRVDIGRSNANNRHNGEVHRGARGFTLGMVPTPQAWVRYENFLRDNDSSDLSPLRFPVTSGLPDEPVSPTRMWTIRPDPDHPGPAADPDDVAFIDKHLDWAVETLAQRGLELIEPARLLKELLNRPEKGYGTWQHIAVLLAEYGPSSALDEAIAHIEADGPNDIATLIQRFAAER